MVSSLVHQSPNDSAQKDTSQDSSLQIIKVIKSIQIPETERDSSIKHISVAVETLEDEHFHLRRMIAKLQDENQKLKKKNAEQE